jgi:conjugative transfer signal peptidase TraF
MAEGATCAPGLERSASLAAAERRPRLALAALASIAALAALSSGVLRPRPLLVWNASPSSPVGLYRVGPSVDARRGAMALAWAPARARRLASKRGYLPFRVPLVKPVAAVAGDRVCAKGDRLFVNGRPAARRRARDPSGRRMPWWSGCLRLGRGELFLLSAGVADAFDGRYFGATRASEVIGAASLVWRA